MKALILMIVLTSGGVVSSIVVHPIYGLAIYYLFAVIRPQYLWQWVLPEGVNWSLYLFFGTGIGAMFHAMFQFHLTRTHFLVFVFAAWVCVCYCTAVVPAMGNLWMIDYGKYLLGYVLSMVVARRIGHLWALTLMIPVGLAYIAYVINDLYLSIGYLRINENGFGGHDNNGAGLLLALGVPLCYFAWEGIRHKCRWFFLCCIPPIIHAVLMTYSRGAMVSLITPVPLYFLRAKRKAMLCLITVGMAFLLPILAGKEIRARFFTVQQYEAEESAQRRFSSWHAAWLIACDYPLTGVGVRNSPLFSRTYGADMDGRVIHSQYLQLLADMGFPGMTLYLLILYSAWQSLRTTMAQTKRSDLPGAHETYFMAAGLEAALMTFCTGAIFLSLESFEVQYLLIFIAGQMSVVWQDHAQREVAARQLAASTPEPAAPEYPRIVWGAAR
jgi:probable O-glycosylation ligase (exosortase A-associated)